MNSNSRVTFLVTVLMFVFSITSEVYGIIKGEATFEHAQVGAVLEIQNDSKEKLVGTGVLIAPNIFLTAAHVVCGDAHSGCTPSRYIIFLQNAGKVEVTEVWLEEDELTISEVFAPAEWGTYGVDGKPGSDYAMLKLKNPVYGIPFTITLSSHSPNEDAVVEITGFGTKEGGPDDVPFFGSGIKRKGTMIISNCDTVKFDCDNLSSDQCTASHKDEIVCAKFDNLNHSNTCNLDSGGPLLLKTNNGISTYGIVLGGDKSISSCENPNDITIFTSVSHFKGDIENIVDQMQVAAENNELVNVEIFTKNDHFSSADETIFFPSEDSYFYVETHSKVKSLTASINGANDDNNDNDYSISLKHENDQGDENNCYYANTNISAFSSCRINNPQSGRWHVKARKHSGNGGDIQITVTALVERSLIETDYEFLDVPINHPDKNSAENWNWEKKREAIKGLFKKGLIQGQRYGIFNPDANINRAEIAAIILDAAHKALGVQTLESKRAYTANHFPDVDCDKPEWYCDYVKELYEAEVVDGYSTNVFKNGELIIKAGTYGPNRNIILIIMDFGGTIDILS